MPAIRGIVTSVGYGDLLAISLVHNMRHLVECVVVTTTNDEVTQLVARDVPGVRVFETDAFTRADTRGQTPRFNKGLALEEGFDVLGRHGWILILDADTLLPDDLALDDLAVDTLYGAHRRVLADPADWRPDLDWATVPLVTDDAATIGFFQLFHADAAAVRGKRPWYDVSFAHAGGGDAYFLNHWSATRRRNLPVETLHLGPIDTNWFGRDPASQELMAAYVHRVGWRRGMTSHDLAAANQAGAIVDRVEVAGYAPSTFIPRHERYPLPSWVTTEARAKRSAWRRQGGG